MHPHVEITGPSGFHHVIEKTTRFENVEPGGYAIVAPAARPPSLIVEEIQDGTVDASPAVLVAHKETRVHVTYRRRAGTGLLWDVVDHSKLEAWDPDALTTGAVAATFVRDLGADRDLMRLAFDSSGNLWACGTDHVTTTADPTTWRIPAALLEGPGALEPDITLTIDPASIPPGGLNVFFMPTGMTFDTAGNLWFAGGLSLARFDKADLGVSGRVRPAARVDLTDTGGIKGLAFDAHGGAWLTTSWLDSSTNTMPPEVLGLVPTPQGTGLAPLVQSVALRGHGPATASWPCELALDAAGTLWAVDLGENSIFGVRAVHLGATGALTPDVLLQFPTAFGPRYLALDAAGGIWVAAAAGGALWRLAPETLAQSGVAASQVQLGKEGDSWRHALAFTPRLAN